MKKKLKLVPVIMALLTISCSVWAQVGKGEVSYTINGGKFHNQSVSFSANPKAMSSFAGVSGGYMKIYIDDAPSADADSKYALVMIFNKAGTGTAKVFDPINNATGEDKGAVVCFTLGLPSYFLSRSLNFPKHTPGTITITKFGSVGGTVEGTFEGTLTDLAGTKYTITGGHFVVIRRG